MGVRTVQLAHETNNTFSGAAYHRDLFEILSQLKSYLNTIGANTGNIGGSAESTIKMWDRICDNSRTTVLKRRGQQLSFRNRHGAFIAWICSGPILQQPPMSCAPEAIQRLAAASQAFGVEVPCQVLSTGSKCSPELG